MRRLIAAALLTCCVRLAAADVMADHMWARATPPGSTIAVVYGQLRADRADELLSITSPIASRIEIHLSQLDAGMMRMRRVPSVSLPAHTPVKLESGGLHAMLIDLHGPLLAGTSIELTLMFRASPSITVTAKVIGPGDSAPGG